MKESELIFGLFSSFNKEEFSYADLEWLTEPFTVSETSLRSNLSRMAKQNILQIRKDGRKAYYSLGVKSKRISSNVAMGFRKPDWTGWDNDWWGFSVSMPVTEKSSRYYINKKLTHYRFAILHPGFWIRPYNNNEALDQKLDNIIRSKYTKAIRFRFFSDEELRKVPELYNIAGLNKEFESCLNYINKCHSHFNLENPRDAHIGRMIAGDKIVRQLFKDPLLPDQFLPDSWQGDNLRTAFKDWETLTRTKSEPYWKRIFNNTLNTN